MCAFFSAADGAKMRVCVMLFVVLLLNGTLSESQRDGSVIIRGKGSPNYPTFYYFCFSLFLFDLNFHVCQSKKATL